MRIFTLYKHVVRGLMIEISRWKKRAVKRFCPSQLKTRLVSNSLRYYVIFT